MSNWKNEVIKDKDSKWSEGDLSKINPKMLLNKDELGLTPSYYIGKIFKYQASHIIEDFGLSYNIGSVCSYILRAGSKKSKAKVITEDLGYYMQFGFKRIPSPDNGRYHTIKHAKKPYAIFNAYE